MGLLLSVGGLHFVPVHRVVVSQPKEGGREGRREEGREGVWQRKRDGVKREKGEYLTRREERRGGR